MRPQHRWSAILLQLQATDDWQRATDLAAAIGVSQRTIYRDVQALEDAGVPIRGVPGHGYRLPDDYRLDPVVLTVDEAMMLVLGAGYAAQNFEGHHQAAAQAAQHKLEARLPDAACKRARSLQDAVSLVPASVFGNPAEAALLQTVRRALVEERALQYHSPRTQPPGPDAPEPQATDNGETVRVHPYGLVRQGSTWHLVGYHPARGRVRHVRLDRLRDVEVLEETFERPAGYQSAPDEAEATPGYPVRVIFSDAVADTVQPPPALHVDATERRSDGRLLMTLRVHRADEALPWLLSWGRHVRVLAPTTLQRRLRQEAKTIAAQYPDTPTLLP
jgi:predicted DNA-binding transcriptional regulator YafY